MNEKYHACTCEDNVVGGPWLRDPSRPAAALNKEYNLVLFQCEKCLGYVIINVDWHGKTSIQAPLPSNLTAFFPEWLRDQAKKDNTTTADIVNSIGERYLHAAAKAATNGCAQCRFVKPYNPDPDETLKLLIRENSGRIYQCPKCGSYRWMYFESHGHAEIPKWGIPTKEDLLAFKDFLDQESNRTKKTIDEVVENILNKIF
jgi:hypothetical protein